MRKPRSKIMNRPAWMVFSQLSYQVLMGMLAAPWHKDLQIEAAVRKYIREELDSRRKLSPV